MGGNFTVEVVNGEDQHLTEAFNLLNDLEQKWTRYSDSSEISKLNNSDGIPVEVSEHTLILIKKMIWANKITSGYFDPTTLPLQLANGNTTSNHDSTKITKISKSARWPGNLDDILFSENKVTLPLGTTLDSGGIGKGLAADLVIELLSNYNLAGAMVNANGDVVVSGEAPQGGDWIIGVEHPYQPEIELDQIKLTDCAVATSSKVHQKWQIAGKDFHHLINPVTGSIAVNSVLSASVICDRGADAEVLAKVPFVLEIEPALAFIENLGAEGFIVTDQMQTHQTKGWSKFK